MNKYLDSIVQWQKPHSFEKLIELTAETDRLNNMGVNSYKAGNSEFAKKYFSEALEVYPPNDDALKNLSILLIDELRKNNVASSIEIWGELNSLLVALEVLKNRDLRILKIALLILNGILSSNEKRLDEANYPISKLREECKSVFDITEVTRHCALSAVKLVDTSYTEIIQMITPYLDFREEFGSFCIYEKYRVERKHLIEAMKQLISEL